MRGPQPSDIDLPPTVSVDLSHLVAVALEGGCDVHDGNCGRTRASRMSIRSRGMRVDKRNLSVHGEHGRWWSRPAHVCAEPPTVTEENP